MWRNDINSLSLPKKNKNMAKMTKEELLKALKKAWQNKEEARKRTADDWANEGITGNVVLL